MGLYFMVYTLGLNLMQLQKLIANILSKKKKNLIAKVLFRKQAEELMAKVSYQYKYHSKLIAFFSFFFFFFKGAGICLAQR